MRVFFYSALTLLVVLLGGSQLRIAKITIKEPGRARTVIRVCWPGRDPNFFAMTDQDFMCHTYDWYGLRHLGGFGLATQDSAKAEPPKVDQDSESEWSLGAPPPMIPGERDREVLGLVL